MNKVVMVKWKPITGVPDYYVSNNGMVKKIENGKHLLVRQTLTQDNSSGRLRVWLPNILKNGGRTCGGQKSHYVHLLVFNHFSNIKRPKGFEIHHKDFNFLNNHIDNLQLVSPQEHREIHLNARNNGK